MSKTSKRTLLRSTMNNVFSHTHIVVNFGYLLHSLNLNNIFIVVQGSS